MPTPDISPVLPPGPSPTSPPNFLNNLLELLSDPRQYLLNHPEGAMAVMTGAPLPILAIVILAIAGTWLVARSRYKNRIEDFKSRIEALESRLRFKDDEISHLQVTAKSPALTSLPLFYPSYFEHTFLIRDTNGEQQAFNPTTKQAGVLILQITATFTAIPDVMVEQVFLEIVNKRLPSQWEPYPVHHRMTPDIDFIVPEWINSGVHIVKLIAVGAGFETPSPEFQINFPAR